VKIIWADNDPSWGIPNEEEVKEELAKDQESSPSETPQEETKEKNAWRFKGFG
jgi:hypothetical protein